MSFAVQAHVFFDGDCADAVAFYEKALQARVHVITHAEAGDTECPEQNDRVMHATVSVNGASFFASDAPLGQAFDPGARVQLSVGVADVTSGRRYFELLAQGGEVVSPFKRQPSGDSYGMLRDRFGVCWIVSAAGDTR